VRRSKFSYVVSSREKSRLCIEDCGPHWFASPRVFWPAHLARLSEEHTNSGRHVVKIDPFPDWVPPLVSARARKLAEKSAVDLLSASDPTLFAHKNRQ
jgi:hypothetical protein